MTSFLRALVAVYAVAAVTAVAFAVIARYCWRRGKDLEEL